jgi:aminopeptidase N
MKNPDYRIVHDNLTDMSKVVTIQTYQKGSWILHMLRGVVGTDIFWKGIQSYYKKYKDLNATTEDFKKEMEKVSGMNLEHFFQQWLYKPGTLKYKGNWEYNARKKEVRIHLNQVQTDGSFFKMPLELGLYGSEKKQTLIEKLAINEKSNTFTIPVDFEPERIILDPNYWVLMEVDFKKK